MIQDNPQIIDLNLKQLKDAYLTHKTHDLRYRKQQLGQLLKGLQDLKQEFNEALDKDLGMKKFGSELFSVLITKIEIEHVLKNFEKWSKPKKVDTPLVIGPAQSRIIYEPLGVVLVISSWNYPVYTSLPPLAAAIAAGNCAILKPSELAPHSSNVLKKLFDKYLDRDCYRVIEGGLQVALEITTKPFDLIIFTGSPDKGKMVAQAASQNLVPCILELGGKNPTIVDKDADLGITALRLVQGRYLNAGQTCVACDFIIVHESIKGALIKELIKKTQEFFGKDASFSQDYSRIVSPQHAQRLAKLLDPNDHKGKLIYGGKYDVESRYIEPTIIDGPDLNSKVMTEEIFGPILPIITFKEFSEVVQLINSRPKPLALHYFGGSTSNKQTLEKQTSSGSLLFNDVAFHLLSPYLPFGGVGQSGYSAYHGIYGFQNCSHAKPVYDKSTLNIWPFNARYPPYTPQKQRLLLFLFKFSHITQRSVSNTIILILLLSGMNVARQNPREMKLLQEKIAPYLKNLWPQLPGL